MTRRLGGDGGVKFIKLEANKITIRPGGHRHMHWDIEADEPPLGVIELVRLFTVSEVEHGDEVDIEFLVEDRDLVPDDVPEISAAVNRGEGVEDSPFVDASGASLSTNQRRLLAHIAKHSLGLFGRQQSGTAILCAHAIRIQRDEAEQ
jgi:hypothetical protein